MNKAIKILGLIAGINLIGANFAGGYEMPILGDITPVYMEVECILTGKQYTWMAQNKATRVQRSIAHSGIAFGVDACELF